MEDKGQVRANGFVGELGEYEELVVLQHGLQGQVGDFNYLIRRISEANASTGSKVALHVSDVNSNRTNDGIDKGGRRLAEDIKRIIGVHGGSLKRISIMGFSLGGMYVRYAIALLLDKDTGKIAGLIPNKLVLVASPNLGSRKFGFVRYVPAQGHGLAHTLFGDTGKQLMLLDEGRLVVEMTSNDSGGRLPFMSALKVFKERLIYGNTRGDAMVPYGTATLNPANRSTNLHPLTLPHGAKEIDMRPDEMGSRVWFTYEYAKDSSSIATLGMISDEKDAQNEEVLMATRLRSIGWKVTCVDFEMPFWLPINHNKVVAMSRNMIHTWINAPGRRIVHHLVDNLIFNSEDPMFNRVVALS
eukprot:Plantae.Rhodophyta-Hildenbrandia_rubra.ctg6375.p1 GENE.Plantae.Rhodophyta-Hildenbrandia_rubra.ctg6375~~Plantae.Rhodophyta-Hildenbrandia_rubra.ctg6375.p1  ORF type:complete len:409 (+),score=72.52 Plantae.Rhodophyta-Hildenbrandia_rubra.ctg6375:157-1227(+)